MNELKQNAVIKSKKRKAPSMFVGLHFFAFSHPQQLQKYSSIISSSSTTQICIELQSSSGLLCLSDHHLTSNLERKKKKTANITLCTASVALSDSVIALASLPEAHLYSISLMPVGPLHQWSMVTVFPLVSNLYACPSPPLRNKTLSSDRAVGSH